MNIGKLDNSDLEYLILNKFKHTRPEVINGPRVGSDCASLRLENNLTIVSCDPITAASPKELGLLSVHISCNDAAAAGAEPVGLLITLLVPPETTKAEIGRIADDISSAASLVHVDILGGHTEVTDAVTRPVTNTTILAKIPPELQMSGPNVDDDIIMTKWAAIEGSIIAASDFPEKVRSVIGESGYNRVTGWKEKLSVVPEGIFAVHHGATSMHDVTEGGVLGGAWEIAYAAGLGIEINKDAIPLKDETKAICSAFQINPLRFISSGSLLITCPNGSDMISGLQSMNIPAVKIGKIIKNGYFFSDGTVIGPVERDELYRLFSD